MLPIYRTNNQSEETICQLQQTVNTLMETLIKPDRLKCDIFFTLLHSVMKENNFVLNKKIGEPLSIVEYILSMRSTDDAIYEALFTFDEFIHMPLKIICCPLTDLILINATIPQIYKETYSICFKINKFVITSQLGTPTAFANLDELFTLFKEKIVIPVKSAILIHHKFVSGSLSGLPDDLIYIILLQLPLRDILNLAECCKRLNTLVKEQSLWSQLYRRDFPDKNASEQGSWYDTYKGTYTLAKTERLKHARNVTAESFQEFRVLPDQFRPVDSRWEVIL